MQISIGNRTLPGFASVFESGDALSIAAVLLPWSNAQIEAFVLTDDPASAWRGSAQLLPVFPSNLVSRPCADPLIEGLQMDNGRGSLFQNPSRLPKQMENDKGHYHSLIAATRQGARMFDTSPKPTQVKTAQPSLGRVPP